MVPAEADDAPIDFDLVHRGYAYRFINDLLRRSRLPKILSKILLLLAISWLPLMILSLCGGHAVSDETKVPFFSDPEVHVRLLFSLPLLQLAEASIAFSLSVQANHLLGMKIVAESDRSKFRSFQAEILRWRESGIVEGVILVLAYLMSFVLRLYVGFSDGMSSWERVSGTVTIAGWWHMLVSLPILYFFMLRWLLIFVLWSAFLYRVSRLDLKFTPTHPDHAGGIGFLGWGIASFSLVLMSISAVFSAGMASEIYQHGESLSSLKYHVIIFVVVALLVLHAPLLSFSPKLARCRFRGLLQFGALVWEHDRAFDEKWIEHTPPEGVESILGTADVQSMSDIATCYGHINEMWPIPFDTKAFAVLVLSALLPLVPLVGTQIPLQEIFAKLGEMLI